MLTLQSWKEIAQYLGRGVRTVQRWEGYGMPVHRPAGRERSAVLAIAHELDEWMQQTQTKLRGQLHANGKVGGPHISRLEQEVRAQRQ